MILNKPTAVDRIDSAGDPAPLRRSRHPLEIIPYFQRFAPSAGRNFLYTLIWNSLFAAFFALLSLLYRPDASIVQVFWTCMLIANCIGFLIHGSFAMGGRLLKGWLCRQSSGVISLYYCVVSVVCVFAGQWVAFTVLEWHDAKRYMLSAQGATGLLLLSVFISVILASIFHLRERRARADAAFQAERARVESAERQFHLARFKLLEAQVEPHFLYNTLANVISLIDPDPAAAKRMIERLIDYLRGAAVAAGTADATLGSQLDLLRAYLDLIVLRMGSRLRYRIEIAPELEALPLPPMLIQPLAENAIKHGLEPKVGGGEVVVRASRVGDDVTLIVADDGLGVRTAGQGASTGIGLANLRQRLATLYGGRARLTLEDAQPGTRVTVTLPAASLA
jgi:sensor histidine kinase YesM